MQVTLDESHFPLRIAPDSPVSDEELLRFTSATKGLRVERDKTGEIVVTTPTGNRTGMKSLYIGRMLGNWTEEDGRGYAFDSNTGFSLPDGVRNFNGSDRPDILGGWWQAPFCWVWDGLRFRKTRSLNEKKWRIGAGWKQASLLEDFGNRHH